LCIDRVLAECRLILFEAKAPQPTSEVHAGVLTCPARMMVQAKQRVHCRGPSSNRTLLLGKGPPMPPRGFLSGRSSPRAIRRTSDHHQEGWPTHSRSYRFRTPHHRDLILLVGFADIAGDHLG